MDIQAYITSGILESYALGLTSQAENVELASLAEKFPAIRIELEKTELTLLKYAKLNSKHPPEEIRTALFARMDDLEKESNIKWKTKANSGSQNNAKHKVWQIVTLILLIALGVSASYIYWQSELISVEKRNIVKFQNHIKRIGDSMKEITAHKKEIEAALDKLVACGNITVEMKGTDKMPDASAYVVYNQKLKKIVLKIHTLSSPSDISQYQLWGIVYGKPVDLGVIAHDPSPYQLYDMKFADNCQSFIVTISPMGGSQLPDLDQIILTGKLN